MRKILWWAAAAAILAAPASGWCQQTDPKAGSRDQSQTSGQSNSTTTTTTQSPAPQQESLADAARKAREAKKDAPKIAKVIDNDSLPSTGGISTVGNSAAAKDDADAKASAGGTGAKNGEKEWRGKFADLRAKLKRDQDDLAVMQRELGVDSVQYNGGDPMKALQQQLTRDDINKKTAAIDAKTQAIQADQQAIDDAEDALRKSGGDAGWAR
jgi:hypothetical protein